MPSTERYAPSDRAAASVESGPMAGPAQLVRQVSLVLVSCGLSCGALAAQGTGSSLEEDLDYLSARIQLIHPAPTGSDAKEAFRRRTETLRQRLDGMDRVTFALEIAGLTASLRDAHTRLLLGSIEPSLRSVPVQFGVFSEGIVITAATERYRDLAGASVQRIGRLDAQMALERLRPLVSFENESWFRQAAPRRLAEIEILRLVGAVDDVEHIDLRVSRNGVEEDVRLEVPSADVGPRWIDARTPSNLAAFRHRHPGVKHWFEALPDSRALYFQYDEVADDGPRSAAAHANLGRAYLRAGDRARALEEYERARAIDPTDPRTLAAVDNLTAP